MTLLLFSSTWRRRLHFLLCCWLLSFQVQAFSIIPPLLNPVSNTARSQLVLHAKNDNNQNPISSISSDGVVSGAPRPTGSLGKPSRKKKTAANSSSAKQQPMSKKERQRTANGSIDSTSSGKSNDKNIDPSEQGIQVVRGNRGNKMVTIIRGMTTTLVDDKKKLLKTLKSKLGVGGTLVDGVLELQGDHVDKVVDLLQGIGYTKARKVGK